MAVKTAEITAAKSGTFHDGRSMIVLKEGEKATVAETSLPFLRERDLIQDGSASSGGEGVETELPGLTGKTKDELKAIAEAEEVNLEDGMTNPQIVEAIEAKREADGAPPA